MQFDEKQWQDALKLGHVNSITCFSKCHHGWSYHPTKVGKMHPHLSFDLLRAQIDAAKADRRQRARSTSPPGWTTSWPPSIPSGGR